MRIGHRRRLYFPALSLVAVVGILLVLISVSTYRNLHRDRQRALEFLHRQGVTLLNAMEAGARASMGMPMWQEAAIGSLIREMARNPDIAFVYLEDANGMIRYHSDAAMEGKQADWHPSPLGLEAVEDRIIKETGGNPVYEIAKRFAPLAGARAHPPMMMMGASVSKDMILVLGLTMTEFRAARKADFDHALIMAGIVVALGSGIIFFIFVIQNYYLVDRALQQTQDYTRQVLANMANGLISLDPAGRVVTYNRIALDLIGIEESRIQRMDLGQCIDFTAAGIADTLAEPHPVMEREIAFRNARGACIPLALSVSPIIDEARRFTGAVVVLRDLREIKRLEEKVRRSEKLAAIGALAAGVAHEIRNPLSSIRGFAQFLGNGLADRPKEQEYARVMVREVDRINRVVTDLLTFSRPMETTLAKADVSDLVTHTLRLVETDAANRGISLRNATPAGLGSWPLDANQITQALLNLLLNAVAHAPVKGCVTAGAQVDLQEKQLWIWVQDDGPGIPADQQRRIFDPFFTTRDKGTGLGLAIVHKIAENHHGEVMLECPPPGKPNGCRFTLRFGDETAPTQDTELRHDT
jgi:two-component system sensor histidine kinase HydH